MQNFNLKHGFYNDGGRAHTLSKLRWNAYMMDVLHDIKRKSKINQLIMCSYCEDYLPYSKVIPYDHTEKSFLCNECFLDATDNYGRWK